MGRPIEKMVSPTCCVPGEAGGRQQYSRGSMPYSFSYPHHRRFHLGSHDNRAMIMADREDSDQPRKRIAVACGRCRKRKIRCSGDPGNGGPCSNCKNAGYEPCLFLRVSSQETPFKETNDFMYNLDAARTYSHHSRGPVSPLSPVTHYAHEMAAGDGMASYRQPAYPYNTGRSYYPNMAGWAGTYQDDGAVDYNLNYSSYQMMPEQSQLVSNYSPYNTARRPVYVEQPEGYSYSNLAHRPATSSDNQGFSLSSIAASLPNASAERLHSSVNRTLTSPTSSHARGDAALASSYANSKASSSTSISEVPYGNLQPSFEPAYPTSSTLASAIAHRATAHADAAYPTGGAVSDQLYTTPGEQSMRPAPEDAGPGLSYVYSEPTKLGSGGSRRDSSHSHSGTGTGTGAGGPGSLLANGHVYVPESHSAHAHPNPTVTSHPYILPSAVVPSTSSSHQTRTSTPVVVDASGSATATGTGTSVVRSSSTTGGVGVSTGNGGTNSSGGGSSQQRLSDNHRRSAGSLRGG
ncbi:hypothetical protein F4777DRAFT_76060 [Nemania sp. FL0916]|nr:hypothetical protein F4777DRAFT_76060 [Nemania sp. FL0916]